MHTLHCVLTIVNILFIISYEGVKPTFLINPKINNDLEDNNHILHNKNQRDASDIYKNNLKLSNEHDGENEVNIITSLINAWKRKVEQKKANENIKVKDKQKNDEKIILFLYDMESGHLIGRAGTTINNFINNINDRFNGQVVKNAQGAQIQNFHSSSEKGNYDQKSNTQKSHSSSDRENHDYKSRTQKSHSSSDRENHNYKSRTQKSHSSSDRENHDYKSRTQKSHSSSDRENHDYKSRTQKSHSSSDRENHNHKSYAQNSYSNGEENHDHKSYNQNSYSSGEENQYHKSHTHSHGQYHGYNPYSRYSCGNTYYG